MTYKLNPDVEKILAPVIVKFTDNTPESYFKCGADLARKEFPKWYLIDSLTVDGNSVVLTLSENDQINIINWVGEDPISFF